MSFLPFPAPRSVRPATGPPPEATFEQVELPNKQLMTKTYTCGANVIDFPAFFKQVKSLHNHPPCSHRPDTSCWPCGDCEKPFLEQFWSTAARFLDYFAEFYRIDTGIMHSVWFLLFDLWQESAMWLQQKNRPLTYGAGAHQAAQDIAKLSQFKAEYKETLDLVDIVLGPGVSKELKAAPHEPIIFPPTGDVSLPGGECSFGPYRSGLKPWQQFLYSGSPGCALGKTSTGSLHQSVNPMNSNSPREMADKSNASSSQASSSDQPQTHVRYLPPGAIAILAQRTKYETALLARLAAQHDANSPTKNEGSNPYNTEEYEKHALPHPTKPNAVPHVYENMYGGTTSYYLANGFPPIYRYQGFGDPNLEVDDPGFLLVDECVAMCLGVEPYVPVTGVGYGGDGETGNEEWEDGVDLWVVEETKGRGVSGKGKVRGSGKMFDNFVGRDDPWC